MMIENFLNFPEGWEQGGRGGGGGVPKHYRVRNGPDPDTSFQNSMLRIRILDPSVTSVNVLFYKLRKYNNVNHFLLSEIYL